MYSENEILQQEIYGNTEVMPLAKAENINQRNLKWKPLGNGTLLQIEKILGLMVDLRERYVITSNRESRFGRYDIMLEPLKEDDAIIIEFKVLNKRREKSLEDTLASALARIEEKGYAQTLISYGAASEHIRKYGFAFEGKTVLIG